MPWKWPYTRGPSPAQEGLRDLRSRTRRVEYESLPDASRQTTLDAAGEFYSETGEAEQSLRNYRRRRSDLNRSFVEDDLWDLREASVKFVGGVAGTAPAGVRRDVSRITRRTIRTTDQVEEELD